MSGSGAERVIGSPPSDAEASPQLRPSKRPRSPDSLSLWASRSRSPAPSPSASWSRSPVPSPSASRSRPSPPRTTYSPTSPPYNQRRSTSRSRVSEETDGHGRTVWRPHSYRELGEQGHGEFSVRINDYDRLFTCRSCGRILSPPVYQCAAGHLTCSRCDSEVAGDLCGFCGSRDGYGRSQAVEALLAGISFACRNQQHGCETFLPHHEMRAHERSCRHEPCFCPVPRCGFAGRTYELEVHLASHHHWDVINFRYGESFQAPAHARAILRCEDYGELFHINNFQEGCGSALSMICIRPDNARKQEFTYELTLPAGGGVGQHRLKIQSTVWNTSLRYGMGEGNGVFLMVPDKMPGTDQRGSAVEVCIHK